jgi:hypothetical protein
LLFMSYILTVNDLKKIKYDDKTLLISLWWLIEKNEKESKNMKIWTLLKYWIIDSSK